MSCPELEGLWGLLLKAYLARQFLNFLLTRWALLTAPSILKSCPWSTSDCQGADPHHQDGKESIFGLPRVMGDPDTPPIGLQLLSLWSKLGHRANLLHSKQEAVAWLLHSIRHSLSGWSRRASPAAWSCLVILLKGGFERHYQSLMEDLYRASY